MLIVIATLYLVVAYCLIRGFRRIDETGQVLSIKKLSLWLAIIFMCPAFLPVFSGTKDKSLFHFYLIWPLLYGVLFRSFMRPLGYVFRRIKQLRYLGIFLLTWVLETFLVIDYNRAGFEQNYGVEAAIRYGAPGALWKHLFSYIGFYAGIALVIGFFLWKYKISLHKAFVVGGLWGVLIEQNFLGLKLLFSNPFAFLTFGPWTFITYGMYIAGPYLFFYEEIITSLRKETKFASVKLFLMISTIPLITWGVWTRLYS